MSTNKKDIVPLVIIGAGPVGLAAAAQAVSRGIEPIVLEASTEIAANLRDVAHVRLFSPWQYDIDNAARDLLVKTGWKAPDLEALPTAGEIVDDYLLPLSKLPQISRGLRLGHRVVHISRYGADKVKTEGREDMPFLIRVHTEQGETEVRAAAVIDASGTWNQPNPVGGNGIPARGEETVRSKTSFGMPDILGKQRSRFARKKVLVLGSGHSASGNLIALARLAEDHPGTTAVWAVRGKDVSRSFGGGEADGLPARGELGLRLKTLRDQAKFVQFNNFTTAKLGTNNGKISIESDDGQIIEGIDEIIAATGSRPDLKIARELRLKLDPWLESTESLAPLIDPNVHSCGTVPPHGHRELAHPEKNFYVAGAKSYGRATNFLLATGYEQVRSIVAALAGDFEAADKVQLVLPETGVCSSDSSSGSACCGGPASSEADACCVLDEQAKASGEQGCGCGSPVVKVQKFERLKASQLV